VGHIACIGEMRNAYKMLIRIPEEKTPLVRARHKWEDNIRVDLREVGWENVEWMHLAQGRDQWWNHVNTIMNLQIL